MAERQNSDRFQRFGDVARGQPLGKAFDYRSLSYSCFANEDGVVLALSQKYYDQLLDVAVAAADRLQFAPDSRSHQVPGKSLQSIFGVKGETHGSSNSFRAANRILHHFGGYVDKMAVM